MRADLQMVATSESDVAPGSEFVLRRARFWAAGRVNDWIEGMVSFDVGAGRAVGRYMFARFTFDPVLRVTAGQFKRAFDVFELTSSAQILAIERDGSPAGVSSCSGVGGVCSYSRFAERLRYASLDVGLLVDGELADGKLAYLVSLTNGEGGNSRATNGAKSFAGRLEWFPNASLKLGGNVSVHDYEDGVAGETRYGAATSVDAEWGAYGSDGVHVQAGVMTGDNWRALDASGDSPRFLTYQGVVSYRVPRSGGGRIHAIEPVARVSWGDPDRTTGRDDGWLFTPGLMLHVAGRSRLAANVDMWRPATGESAWGIRLQSVVYF